MPTRSAIDVAILGSGPAAWSAAAAVAERGLQVALIAPEPTKVWAQTYGAWTDQLNDEVLALLGGSRPWACVWERVVVRGDHVTELNRSYGRLANSAVRDALHATAESCGRLRVRIGSATSIETTSTGSVVHLGSERSVAATVVLDGTGANSAFCLRGPMPRHRVLQTAYGIVAELGGGALEDDVCTLMDWTGPDRADPTFAYLLPFDDAWLVEETSLAQGGGLSMAELEVRLYARLKLAGLTVRRVRAVEHVSFPMDVPLPDLGQRVVGLGAAAALVHPATGYSVAASLRAAPRIANALSDVLGSPNGGPVAAAAAAWQVLWPTDRLRARALETYGLERVRSMDQRTIREFFDAFFGLPAHDTSRYLSGEAAASEVAGVMWRVFRRASPRLRRRLASGNPLALARALTGSGQRFRPNSARSVTVTPLP